VILKLAVAVLRVAIVGDRSPAAPDRFAEDLGRKLGDPLDSRPPELPRAGGRPDTGMKENFVGVDVADARDRRLIEEQVPDSAPGVACQAAVSDFRFLRN